MADAKTTPARTQKSGQEVESDNKTQTQGAGNTEGSAPGQVAPLESEANPKGDPNVSTGQVGESEVIHAQEHVLGDDPRRTAHKEGGFHDSLSGRAVDQSGNFTDTATKGSEGPIPSHRIVANNWPQERENINDPAKREGNTASA